MFSKAYQVRNRGLKLQKSVTPHAISVSAPHFWKGFHIHTPLCPWRVWVIMVRVCPAGSHMGHWWPVIGSKGIDAESYTRTTLPVVIGSSVLNYVVYFLHTLLLCWFKKGSISFKWTSIFTEVYHSSEPAYDDAASSSSKWPWSRYALSKPSIIHKNRCTHHQPINNPSTIHGNRCTHKEPIISTWSKFKGGDDVSPALPPCPNRPASNFSSCCSSNDPSSLGVSLS